MSHIYIAYSISGAGTKTLREHDWDARPLRLLVSYHYFRQWRKDSERDSYRPRSMMLDSGAFSAWKSGAQVDLDALIEESKLPRWGDAVTLDAIGDAEATLANALLMRERGSPAWPVFHYGEPWEYLEEYCRLWPKVGLSCRFGEHVSKSHAWIDQCFARAWPHLFHSFGWVVPSLLERVPFDSADAATWSNGPGAFGRWKLWGRLHGVTSAHQKASTLRSEVDWNLDLERGLEERWSRELEPLRAARRELEGRAA